MSLRYFYDGIWPATRKEFALKGVPSKFEGATYRTLSDDDRRRLDDSIVQSPGFLAVAERATADEESVSRRLSLATSAFADVP